MASSNSQLFNDDKEGFDIDCEGVVLMSAICGHVTLRSNTACGDAYDLLIPPIFDQLGLNLDLVEEVGFAFPDAEGTMKPLKPLDSVTTAPLSQIKKIFLLCRLKYGAEAQFAADVEAEDSGQPKLEEDPAPKKKNKKRSKGKKKVAEDLPSTSATGDVSVTLPEMPTTLPRIEDVVHEMRNMQVTMAELKAQNKQLNCKLDTISSENQQLKEENAEMKKENARILKDNAELRKRVAQLEDKVAKLTAENDKLKHDMNKLKAENDQLKYDMNKLTTENEELKDEASRLRAEVDKLTMENFHLKDTVDNLTDFVIRLTPVHLRILLDYGRQKILETLKYDDWESLRGDKNIPDLEAFVRANIPNIQDTALELICGYSNIRRLGNAAAHTADKDDLRAAVERTHEQRSQLEHVFQFVYNEPF